MVITPNQLLVLYGFGKDFQDYFLHLPVVPEILFLTDIEARVDIYIVLLLRNLSWEHPVRLLEFVYG